MELFSCRNCVHNPNQGVALGRGAGFCLRWNSVLAEPEKTTCKYLHRKDLPSFLVTEAIQEHIREFSIYPGIAELETNHEPLDPAILSLADHTEKYEEAESESALLAFSGSVDGRKSLAFASLVRRCMARPEAWRSSARLVLALLGEVDNEILIGKKDLVVYEGESPEEKKEEARWEVLFARLSGIQEYGEYASLEGLKYPMRSLKKIAAEQDLEKLLGALSPLKEEWQRTVRQAIEDEAAQESALTTEDDSSDTLLRESPIEASYRDRGFGQASRRIKTPHYFGNNQAVHP